MSSTKAPSTKAPSIIRRYREHISARWKQWFSPGRRGERLAVRHLKKQGFKILGTNVRCGQYEIDILARAPDGSMAVVEVKTVINAIAGAPPELRANPDKQIKLLFAMNYLINRYKLVNTQIRFDVVAVELPPNSQPVIRHIPGAFGQGTTARR